MQASNDELPPKNGDRLAWGNGGTIIRPPTSKVNIVKNTTIFIQVPSIDPGHRRQSVPCVVGSLTARALSR